MINKLIAKIRQTGAPIVVGLDPMMKFIPRQIQQAAYAQCGETLEYNNYINATSNFISNNEYFHIKQRTLKHIYNKFKKL